MNTLLFAFLGHTRLWKSLPEVTPPPGMLYEIRALPGGIYASGETQDEACGNLLEMIARTIEASGMTAQDWYVKAANSMSKLERDAYSWVTDTQNGSSPIVSACCGSLLSFSCFWAS